ncbi:MAG: UDP-3-O-(3-hydroxymyristoyl)glucosamine N-acyltransferase [Catalinimonas sp.]
MIELTARQIAELVGGDVEGDGEIRLRRIGKIQEAEPDTVSFLSNPKYEPYLYETRAGAVLVNRDFAPRRDVSAVLIRVEDAYLGFTTLLEEYQRLLALDKEGIEQPAYLGEDATYGVGLYLGAFAYVGKGVRIGNHVKIYPHAFVGDGAVLGDHTVLHPGARVLRGVRVGRHCTLQANAVVGSDGFGFAPQRDGSYRTIPQVGTVVLEDHVDVGAGTVIDRATVGETILRRGVKLDNLIQVAHNVEIGANTVVAAQAGFSGSSTIGAGSMIGGQVGVVGHVALADGTRVAAQSGVAKGVEEPHRTLMGSPAVDLKAHMKSVVLTRRLPELLRRVERLEEKIIPLPPL